MKRTQDNLLKFMVLLPLLTVGWCVAWMALWWLAPGLFVWLAPGPEALLGWLAVQTVITALLLARANVPQMWIFHEAPEIKREAAPVQPAAYRSFVFADETPTLRRRMPGKEGG